MPAAPRLRAFLWVNVACLCWAGNIALGRGFRDDIQPSLLIALRSVAAAALLWALLWVGRCREAAATGRAAGSSERTPWRRSDWGWLLAMSATGFVVYQGLLYQGLHTTGAFNAALINALCPLMTALMAWAVLGTTVSARAIVGIVVSIAGVAAIVSGGELRRIAALEFRIGDLLVLGAVLVWGAYSLIARRVFQRRPLLEATALATTVAVPLTLAWVGLDGSSSSANWSAGLAAAVAYAAVFASVIGMLAWNRAVKLAGPAQAAAAMNMLPVYVLALSVVVLREPPQLHEAVGGLVVVLGCLFGTLAGGAAPARTDTTAR